MNEDQIVDILFRHYNSLFPKTCSSCGKKFETFKTYVEEVTPVGRSVSYDAEVGTWGKGPAPLIGSAAMSNCTCGTTLSLTTDDMEESRRRELLAWIKEQVDASGVAPSDILQRLRVHVRERVLEHSHS